MTVAARKLLKARPKVVTRSITVYEAALGRIRWIFNEFNGNVAVSVSGGKDSTVVMELALIVARERGELPLKVRWLDQEAEFEATVAYQRSVANRPEIDFEWYQIPFRLFNAANHQDEWHHVWDAGAPEKWVRDKEPDSIHENTFRDHRGAVIDRFGALLNRINGQDPDQAILVGIRVDESPQRRLLCTTNPNYKWATWGTSKPYRGKCYHQFYPVYDWMINDVWKAIHDHSWKYNTIYDEQYRYGVPVRNMRVSSYHHVQALRSLAWLQEVEPTTWDRATAMIEGLNAQAQLGSAEELAGKLPYMFKSWEEYMDHLIDNLAIEEHRPTFRKLYEDSVRKLEGMTSRDRVAEEMCTVVVKNDYFGVSLEGWLMAQRAKFLKDSNEGLTNE